ncbi:MAG: CDP-diacylglycerol--glycerol-3-phosphate 3-phosphatidyltransferase [Clostridia bacterium]|nr:CDP-diacylglycerol--glycerol-3-phosphate 3-phosphatidyltransferase [Clostridia bacterium]NDO19902.1 CDP-diacylglycerol--glycerol-3-phosphate 3-phosphatidyltransferase [Lachnospiraceae bacterium MD329]
MNTANKITLIRVLLVPVFMVLFMIDNTMCHYAALGVFVLASVTDAVDGHIARKYNQITTFGKFVDPLADKVLTTAAFLILMYYERMSVWAVMIVLTREFMVAGVRLVAAGDGNVVAASMWGKLKTVSQMAAVIATMLLLHAERFLGVPAQLISDLLIWISVLFTVISGIDYLAKNWHLMKLK